MCQKWTAGRPGNRSYNKALFTSYYIPIILWAHMDCRSCLRVSMWNFRVSFLSPTQQYFHTVALFKTQSLTIYTFPAMESTWWNACYVVVSRRWVYHFRLLLCSLGLLQSIHPPQFPVCCTKLQVSLLGGLHTTFDCRKPYLVHPLGELPALHCFITDPKPYNPAAENPLSIRP